MPAIRRMEFTEGLQAVQRFHSKCRMMPQAIDLKHLRVFSPFLPERGPGGGEVSFLTQRHGGLCHITFTEDLI